MRHERISPGIDSDHDSGIAAGENIDHIQGRPHSGRDDHDLGTAPYHRLTVDIDGAAINGGRAS